MSNFQFHKCQQKGIHQLQFKLINPMVPFMGVDFRRVGGARALQTPRRLGRLGFGAATDMSGSRQDPCAKNNAKVRSFEVQ